MAIKQFLYQHAEGYADTAGLTDETQLGKLTLTGIGGIALDSGNARIVNVGEPTSAQDAATKNYVDTVQSGLYVKAPARVVSESDVNIASAPAAVDGVTLAANDRVLLVGQTVPSQNGVYVFNGVGSAMTRAADSDQNVEWQAGIYVFVNEGNTQGHSAWVLTTDAPIVVGTTDLTFTRFSGLGQVVAGAGITQTGNQLDIGKGDGIAVGADSISIDLAVNPALVLTGTSPDKVLAWLPDGDRGLAKDSVGAFIKLPVNNAGLMFDGSGYLDAKIDGNGGLIKDSLGLGVKIGSVQELNKDGGGLHVVGVPAGFKINGVATGPTVTAANLDTITNGSNADSMHTHTSAVEVPNVKELWVASGPIAKGDGVYISGSGVISKGDAGNDTKSRVIGVAETTVTDASSLKVYVLGTLPNVLTGAVPGTRYFLGTDGQPALIGDLPARSRTVQLGFAKTSNDMTVRVFDFGKKA